MMNTRKKAYENETRVLYTLSWDASSEEVRNRVMKTFKLKEPYDLIVSEPNNPYVTLPGRGSCYCSESEHDGMDRKVVCEKNQLIWSCSKKAPKSEPQLEPEIELIEIIPCELGQFLTCDQVLDWNENAASNVLLNDAFLPFNEEA